MAVQTIFVGLFLVISLSVTDSSPKLIDDQINNGFEGSLEKLKIVNNNARNDAPTQSYPPEIIKALEDGLEKKSATSLLIDELIPEKNKVVFIIQLKEPMSAIEVIKKMREAVAKHTDVELDEIKVSRYDPYSGMVKMFFLYTVKRENESDVLELRPVSDIMEKLTPKKRFRNAGGAIKILDVHYGNEYSNQYPNGRKVSMQSIFSDKNWQAWQLAIVISASLFAIFFIFIVVQLFVGSYPFTKRKVRPVEEPRRVVLQPILHPTVADVGVVQPQPENKDHHMTSVDTDSEHTMSPSRSPMRRGRGLLERRGSNASLTLDLSRSQENIHYGTPPKECSAEEYLLSASKRLTRRQLRSSLKDVKALHSEFWEIPMNHPEKVPIAGSGTKNRYKTIFPNEPTRVQLYENDDDPLTYYINANYIRGYGGEPKAYIATQGPLPHTINDFWQMVWKEKSPLIVMITKLKEKMKVKCEPYIPDYQGCYDDIEVTVMRVIPRDGYTLRELFLRRGNETHMVHHFWYTTWPDHKTPATAKQLLGMALEAEGLRVCGHNGEKSPMIVHCSAGIGRTGCFIAASIGMQQLMEENSVDILGIVCSLRLDRGGMVQTAEQYEFVHQALSIFEMTLPESAGD